MATQLEIKKWGNSIGVVFPKEMVERKHLKVHEKILVEVVRAADLRKLFGTLKSKMSAQEFKDLVREGWK